MRTETKEKQATTIIEKVVKLWDTEYSKKPGMRPTVEKSESRKTIDEGKKIILKGNQFFAKIRLTEKIPSILLYYHFDFNKRTNTFHVRLKYKEKAFVNVDEFSESISSKYKSAKINKISLIPEGRMQKGKMAIRGLAINENFLENKEHSNPEFICDCMEELIRLTQKTVCEYIKI